MLFPLLGLALFCVVSAGIGAAVLALHPRWRVTADTITLFVASSAGPALLASLAYTWLFADARHQLHSALAVNGFFLTELAAIVSGGMLGLHLGRRLFTGRRDQ